MKRIRWILCAVVVMLLAVIAVNSQNCKVQAAGEIPISTVEELLAMESNPSGSYYLTTDIAVPANTSLFAGDVAFSGTFDGGGHKLTGYSYSSTEFCKVGIFCNANGATFKNVSVTDVNINVQSVDSYARIGTLVQQVTDSSFINVKSSGNIVVTGNAVQGDYWVAGICSIATGNVRMEKCSSSVNINMNVTNVWNGVNVGGLVLGGLIKDVKNCSYSGNINLNTTVGGTVTASGIVEGASNVTKCKNTGNITIKVNEPEHKGGNDVTVSGICRRGNVITSCENKGKIKVITPTISGDVLIGGIAGSVESISSTEKKKSKIIKCSNKGAITFSGKGATGTLIGGIAGKSLSTSECYNKGKISVKASGDMNYVGGVCGETYQMKDCYNAGAVNHKGKGFTGGIAGKAYLMGNTLTCCYNVGKVSGSTKYHIGAILGTYEGADVVQKCNIYDNYYIGNVKKPHGESYITWKEWVAKAKKVSLVNKGNCPKLSSKKWTYSAKLKRMILKGNKE